MDLPYRVKELLQKQPIAAEVPASSPALRAFVAVYPLLHKDSPRRQDYFYLGEREVLYHVVRFEIKKEILKEHMTTGWYLNETDPIGLQTIIVADEATLVTILRLWLSDLDQLDAASKSDMP